MQETEHTDGSVVRKFFEAPKPYKGMTEQEALDVLFSRLQQEHAMAIRNPDVVEVRQRKLGRNDPCPCGSGQKFKRCCQWRCERLRRTGRKEEADTLGAQE